LLCAGDGRIFMSDRLLGNIGGKGLKSMLRNVISHINS
jgi:hypothetical protein